MVDLPSDASDPGDLGGEADLEKTAPPRVPDTWTQPSPPAVVAGVVDQALQGMNEKVEEATKGKQISDPDVQETLAAVAEELGAQVSKQLGAADFAGSADAPKEDGASDSAVLGDPDVLKLQEAKDKGGIDLRGAQQHIQDPAKLYCNLNQVAFKTKAWKPRFGNQGLETTHSYRLV